MRDGQKAFIFLAFFWAGLAGTHADDPKQTPTPTILVVEPFDGTKAEVPGWQAATGQGVSQMLIETLENSDQKFQALEIPEPPAPQNSSASNSVSGQTKPTATGSSASKKSGAASKKTAADETVASDTTATNQAAGPAKPSIDETIGSDFTIYGDVTQFMTQTNGGSLGGLLNSLSSLGGKVYTAHVEIAWRIEDSVTKKNIKRLIIATGTGSGSEFVMSPATTATTGGKTAAGGTSAAKTTTAKKNTAAPKNNAEKKTVAGKSGTNNPSALNNFWSKLTKAVDSAPAGGSSNPTAAAGGAAKAKPAGASSQSASAPSGDDATADVDSLTVSYANPVFMKSALGKATASAITNLIAQLDALNLPVSGRLTASNSVADSLKHTPGKILAAPNNDNIVVSLGSKQGFKPGDHLDFYRSSNITDDKGVVVYTNETLVGEIILQSVQDNLSLGSYSGTDKVQQDWIVKAK